MTPTDRMDDANPNSLRPPAVVPIECGRIEVFTDRAGKVQVVPRDGVTQLDIEAALRFLRTTAAAISSQFLHDLANALDAHSEPHKAAILVVHPERQNDSVIASPSVEDGSEAMKRDDDARRGGGDRGSM